MSLWTCTAENAEACNLGHIIQRSAAQGEHLLLVVILPSCLYTVALANTAFLSWSLRKPARLQQAVALTPADRELLRENPPWRDGEALHRDVPMERWCVTREDLEQFKRLVQHRVAEGIIVPSQRDPFDPLDHTIGPSIHTTTKQFIKPVTRAAGSPSWALMKHPKGLPCDLFVTHAWTEGTYELVDKVLNSWPNQVHAAYLCMLSNPQNLQISSMIAHPQDSPFARALGKARHILAVPNQKVSIYKRVWCAYEAFLGYSDRKLISTAVPPLHRFGAKYVRSLCVWVLGMGMAHFLDIGGVHAKDIQGVGNISLTVIALALVCFRSHTDSKRFLATKLAALLVGGILCMASVLRTPLDTEGAAPMLVLTFLVSLVGPWAAEMDCEMEAAAQQQSQQLQKDFTGHLRDAQCSVVADGESIRRELQESGKEKALDGAVRALICMGISSPMLRELVVQAGIMGNLGRWSRTILTVIVHFWVVIPLQHYAFGYCKRAWLSWLAWAELGAWLLMFIWFSRRSRDRQAFTVATGSLFLSVFLVGAWESASGTQAEGRCEPEYVLAFLGGPTIILLTGLGPARVVKLPWVGRPLVRLLLQAYCRKRFAFEKDLDSNEEAEAATSAVTGEAAAATATAVV